MSITPLGVILGLSQEVQTNTRARKNSNSEFTPWSDKHVFPTIRNKNENLEKLKQKSHRKNINRSYFIRKKKSTKSPVDFKNTVRYMTLDISKIPYYYSTERNQQRTLSPSRLRRTYNSSKKELNSELISFECQKSSTKYPGFRKQQQRSKRLRRRKQNKPKYSGLVTNQYIYSKQNQYQSKNPLIINYPIQINKKTSSIKKSANKIMTIYDSFVSKQKHRLSFREVRKQDSLQGRQSKGLPQLLEISQSLFTRDFKYY